MGGVSWLSGTCVAFPFVPAARSGCCQRRVQETTGADVTARPACRAAPVEPVPADERRPPGGRRPPGWGPTLTTDIPSRSWARLYGEPCRGKARTFGALKSRGHTTISRRAYDIPGGFQSGNAAGGKVLRPQGDIARYLRLERVPFLLIQLIPCSGIRGCGLARRCRVLDGRGVQLFRA